MELLKILAIFLLVFYGVKYLFRLLMPFALRKMTERIMQKAQQQQANGGGSTSYSYTSGRNPFDQFKQDTRSQKEGELRVDYVPQEEAKVNKKGTETAGEFVDFEEIK